MGIEFDRLADRYTGKVARRYEAKRRGFPQWRDEQAIIAGFVQRLPPGAEILDVPVGTGRYLEFYKALRFAVTGADVSADMLSLAQRKARRCGLELRTDVADILRLPYRDNGFDAVVCTRLLNWLDADRLRIAAAEMSRVSRRHLIVGVQHWRPLREEMKSPLRIAQVVTQLCYRARLRSKRRKHIHSRRLIEDVLAANNLKILYVRDDFRGGRWKWRGVRYAIYFLEKADPASLCFNQG